MTSEVLEPRQGRKVSLLPAAEISALAYEDDRVEGEQQGETIIPMSSSRKGQSFDQMRESWAEGETDRAFLTAWKEGPTICPTEASMAKFGTLVLLVALAFMGCATTPPGTFAVHTTALTDAGLLKTEYGAPSGAPASVRSFPLTWTGLPANTKVLALSLIDRDYNNYVHWLATDIDPAPGGLKDNESLEATFPQGANDTSGYGYFGPLPPNKHVYGLTVYALSEPTDLEPRFLMEDLQDAMKGHVLATATLELPYDPIVK